MSSRCTHLEQIAYPDLPAEARPEERQALLLDRALTVVAREEVDGTHR